MPKREFVPHERVLLVINDATIHSESRLQKYAQFPLAQRYGKELGTLARRGPFLQCYALGRAGTGPPARRYCHDVGTVAICVKGWCVSDGVALAFIHNIPTHSMTD